MFWGGVDDNDPMPCKPNEIRQFPSSHEWSCQSKFPSKQLREKVRAVPVLVGGGVPPGNGSALGPIPSVLKAHPGQHSRPSSVGPPQRPQSGASTYSALPPGHVAAGGGNQQYTPQPSRHYNSRPPGHMQRGAQESARTHSVRATGANGHVHGHGHGPGNGHVRMDGNGHGRSAGARQQQPSGSVWASRQPSVNPQVSGGVAVQQAAAENAKQKSIWATGVAAPQSKSVWATGVANPQKRKAEWGQGDDPRKR